jgi:ubiquinone biosynthesis protein
MQIPEIIRSRFRFAGDLARAAEVVGVLAKYGLAGWLTDVGWAPVHNALKSDRGEVLTEQPFESRVRLALTDLGTTFVKLGQMLSTRPDLVGQPLATELTKLQQQTPPDSAEVAMHSIETELGRPVSECFKRFDGTALASASIGQVHRVRLKSGRRAVVKVQHPGIEGPIRRDLDILQFLAAIADKNATLRRYEPIGLAREFSRTMLNELDFRREVRNLQAFRRNFAEDETITFPRPYDELTTGRVFTMEFLDGFKITDEKQLEKFQIDRQELAKRGADVFIQMIFRDGFYHADPHPGNFMVLGDGRIALLDAGMVGRIDEPFLFQIEDILLAAGDRDAEALTDAVTRVCGKPPDLDRAALSAALTEFFQEFGTQAVGQFNVSGALTAVSEILHEHKLVLPGKLSMLIKCLMLLEGTGRLLSPAFNLVELLLPWRKRIIMRRFSPAARLKLLRRLYSELERSADVLPRLIAGLVERLDKGTFAIRLEHRHLKSASNRLVVGLFISSMLIGSCVMLASNVRPTAWGISIIGALGLVIAVVFGFRMIWLNRDTKVSHRHGDWD